MFAKTHCVRVPVNMSASRGGVEHMQSYRYHLHRMIYSTVDSLRPNLLETSGRSSLKPCFVINHVTRVRCEPRHLLRVIIE